MSYCSKTDLENVVGVQLVLDLTDDEKSGSGNAEVLVRVTRAISDADAVIDGHLQAEYSVPVIAPIPALLRKLSEDLALFNLYSRRASGLELPAYILQKQIDAMRMLAAIRDGKMELGASPAIGESTGVLNSEAEEWVFTHDTMSEF